MRSIYRCYQLGTPNLQIIAATGDSIVLTGDEALLLQREITQRPAGPQRAEFLIAAWHRIRRERGDEK